MIAYGLKKIMSPNFHPRNKRGICHSELEKKDGRSKARQEKRRLLKMEGSVYGDNRF